jgi:glycosyltransferase involved in cell wall biosynthesis
VDDGAARIARASCLVVASEYEGLPNTALEALSAGVPVVATPAGDLAHLIVDGATGVIAAGVSAPALADAIVRALRDEALRARARTDGPQRVRECYSSDTALAALAPLYRRLHKRTGAAA